MNHSLLVSCHVEQKKRKEKRKKRTQTKLVHLTSVFSYLYFVYNKMKKDTPPPGQFQNAIEKSQKEPASITLKHIHIHDTHFIDFLYTGDVE